MVTYGHHSNHSSVPGYECYLKLSSDHREKMAGITVLLFLLAVCVVCTGIPVPETTASIVTSLGGETMAPPGVQVNANLVQDDDVSVVHDFDDDDDGDGDGDNFEDSRSSHLLDHIYHQMAQGHSTSSNLLHYKSQVDHALAAGTITDDELKAFLTKLRDLNLARPSQVSSSSFWFG